MMPRKTPWVLLAVTLVSNAAGQTATPAPMAADEAAIVLTPFEVSASADLGYQAQNTLAGSRLNTDLKDTPATIDVFTKEFLTDLGATTLEHAMTYANNAEPEMGDTARSYLGTEQVNPQARYQFRSRGVVGTRARNYFETALPIELYATERLDEARGPNSILFGIGSAGGLVNSTTKRASPTRNFGEVEARAGSFNLFRATIDANRVVVPGKVGLRVNLMNNTQDSWRDFLFTHKKAAHGAVTVQPFARTLIRGEYELGSLRGTLTRDWTIRDGVTRWWANGSPTSTNIGTAAPTAAESALGLARLATAGRMTYVQGQDFVYAGRNEWTSSAITLPEGGVTLMRDPQRMPYEANINGPGGRTSHDYRVWGVVLEQKLAEGLFLEVAFHHEDGNWENYDIGFDNVNLRGDPNRFMRNAAEIVALSGYPFVTSGGNLMNPNAGGTYVDVNWRIRPSEFDSNAGRASLAFERDLGRFGRHRLAGLAQRSQTRNAESELREVVLGAPFANGPAAANNQFWRRQYVTLGDSRTFAAPDWANRPTITFNNQGRQLSTGFVNTGASVYDSTRVINSGLVALQSYWLKNRVVTTVGLRRDELKQSRIETTVDRSGIWANSTGLVVLDPSNVSRFTADGETKSAGVVVHVGRGVSLYGNRSNNINTPDFSLRMGIDGGVPPPPRGDGMDAGVQLELLRGKIYGRIGYFRTEAKDISAFMGVNNAFGPNYNDILTALAGRYTAAQMASYSDLRPSTADNSDTLDSKASGYEARFTGNLGPSLRLIANYSYTNQEKFNSYPRTKRIYDQLGQFVREIGAGNLPNPNANGSNGTNLAEYVAYNRTDLDQRSVDFEQSFGVRKHKASVFGNYVFRGERLKGFALGGGATWQSGARAGYDPATLQQYYGNSVFLMEALVRYTKRASFLGRGSFPYTFQLNVRNLLDNQELIQQRFSDDGTVLARFSFQAPREVVFSANMKF